MKAIRMLTIALALVAPAAALAEGEKDEERQTSAAREKSAVQVQQIKSHVVPVVAGIETADKAAAALYELAGLDAVEKTDAQKTVDLAQQGIEIAMTRANALDDMKNLSQDARAEVTTLKGKLREARATLQKLDKKVGARIQRTDMAQIREHAEDVHRSLAGAENAAEQIARAYDISTDLEFGD